MALAGATIERGENGARAGAGFFRAPDRDAIAARGEVDAQFALDEGQMFVMLAEHRGKQAIVVESQCQEIFVFGAAAGLGPGKLLQADTWIQRAAAPSVG